MTPAVESQTDVRLIDLLCQRHIQEILDTSSWPLSQWRCDDCSDLKGADFVCFPGVSEREEYAVHEAGHAFVYWATGAELLEVNLGGNERFAAFTNARIFYEQGSLQSLAALWAGGAAVRTWLERLGLLDDAAEVEIAQAARTDTQVIGDVADSENVIVMAFTLAEQLVTQNWPAIERVADELLARGVLSGAEVVTLITSKPV